jgi:anti-repressor protein
MDNLITIHEGDFPVDARELHDFLEVDSRFNDWIKKRIKEYEFAEGEDFHFFLSRSDAGRETHQFRLTIDVAKELAMVERNERGREARRYFIEVEKQYKQMRDATALPQPGTVASLHREAAKLLTEVAGVKPGIAAAVAYSQIEKRTGEDMSEYKKLLPPAEHETGFLNATEVGKRVGGLSARKVNKLLAELGFQYKENDTKTWRLTDEGKKYGEEFPFERNGHSGYQIKWTERVIEVIPNQIPLKLQKGV